MQELTTAVSKGVNLNLLMLNLVVSVHAAVGDDKTSSNKIVCNHEHAPTPVRQQFLCPSCEATSGFVKARKVGEGLVVIPQEILDAEKDANAAFAKSITLTVHPIEEVTSVLLPSGKSYYLSMEDPGAGALHTYTLLSRLVTRRRDYAFMTKMSLRSAASLFQLTVAGDGTLVLRQMADAELVRKHPKIEFTDLEDKALDLADLLAEQQLTPFVVAEHGTGRSTIIAEYANSQTPLVAASANPVGDIASVTDFTAHLAAMVKAGAKKKAPAKVAAQRVPAQVAPVAPKKAPAKKAAARKPAVRKVS